MKELLKQLSNTIENGKVNKDAKYPPALRGQNGADELAAKAVATGIDPQEILKEALMVGMDRIGKKFAENKAFVPQMLMAAKAMKAALVHLEPFFKSGNVETKGTFIIGTVEGDLHDIGKNLVMLMVEGGGWKVVDLGTNVKAADFVSALDENPGAVIGLSALLTTTMVNMGDITKTIKEKYPETKVTIGGAPVTENFCKEINADFTSSDPKTVVDYLNKLIA